MSTHFGTTWIKKTRKPHSCMWCGKKIEQGQAAAYSTGIFEGDFWCGHTHPECEAAISCANRDDLENGWMPGDYARGRTDDDHHSPPMFSADYRGKDAEQFRINHQ